MSRTKKRSSLDTLIGELYGSLSEQVRFDESLHRLGAVFRSHISALHTEDFGAHRGRVTFVGQVSEKEYLELHQIYNDRWSGQNLWMERSLAGFIEQGYQHGDAVVSRRELVQSPYYRHFLKPLDIRHGLGIPIWRDDKLNMAVASFHRGHGDKGFDAVDFALIAQIRPHLVNAYAIYRRLARLEGELHSLRASLDLASLGVLLFDADGHLLEINAAAERLLLARENICSRHQGRLRFASPATQCAFTHAVKRMNANATSPPESLLVAPDEDGPRLVIHLCTLPTGMLGDLNPRARVLAFVAELQPDQRDALAANILQRLLGLSQTEARLLLALHQHVDVGAAAQSLGIGINTARTHLKHIHAKLGIARNGDLLLIVERLIGSLPSRT